MNIKEKSPLSIFGLLRMLVKLTLSPWSLIKSGGQLYLQSSEDFRSSPGPDHHVYISSGPAIKDNPNGAAYYPLTTKNVDDVVSVLIWCKQFKEYIGSADFGLVQD